MQDLDSIAEDFVAAANLDQHKDQPDLLLLRYLMLHGIMNG